jgi:hypothetical protein
VARYKRSGGKKRSSTGRYVTAKYSKHSPKTTVKESRAGKFADRFIERYPDTFHELSKR